MPKPLTIDASVFVRASTPDDGGFEESRAFLLALGHSLQPIILPTLLRPEVAGAVSRGLRDSSWAAAVLAEIDRLPGVIFVPLDAALAEEAAKIAIRSRMRGADAVYAATASRFDAILVTLDNEQRDRLPSQITACSPSEALERWI